MISNVFCSIIEVSSTRGVVKMKNIFHENKWDKIQKKKQQEKKLKKKEEKAEKEKTEEKK
jgi:hypothetical protein